MLPSASSKSPAPKQRAAVVERAVQHLRQLDVAVRVRGQALAGADAQQEDVGRAVVGQRDAAPAHAGPEPAPGRGAAAAQARGQAMPAGRLPAARCGGAPRGAVRGAAAGARRIDRGQRARQRLAAQHGRRQRLEQRAADGVELAQARAAVRAALDMGWRRRSDVPAAQGVPAAMRQQQFVVGVVVDHGSGASSRRRRWFTASRTRDLTVPSGMPSSRAISRMRAGRRRTTAAAPAPARPAAARRRRARRASRCRVSSCSSGDGAGVGRRRRSRRRPSPPTSAPRPWRRRWSTRRLRAMVKIQVETPARRRIELAALRQTLTIASCASSSASAVGAAAAHQVGLDARREVLEQRREGLPVAVRRATACTSSFSSSLVGIGPRPLLRRHDGQAGRAGRPDRRPLRDGLSGGVHAASTQRGAD